MFTVYFNARQERGRGLSPAEIKASDAINVGMLEEVTEAGLCSWHDIPTEEDVKTVRAWIAANLGNYTIDVAQEIYNDGSYCTEEDVVTGVPCVEQIEKAQTGAAAEWIVEERGEAVKLTEKGVDSVVTVLRTLEGALDWAAGTVAGRAHRSAADFEAVPEQIAPGVWAVRVIEL